MRSTLVIVGVALVLAGFAREAAAGEPAGEAQTSFDKGVGMYKDGDWAGALAEFLAAYKAKPHYSVLYNIAQCHAMLEQNAEAMDTYEKYMEEGADFMSADRRELVLSEIERLEGLLSPVTLDVKPEGAFVMVDGKVVGKAPIGEVVWLDPGEHAFMVQKDGWKTISRTHLLKRGESVTLDFALEEVKTPGKIAVDSKVAGAVVAVDGIEVGPAPWKGEVEAGTHVVKVTAPGGKTDSTEVEVGNGETVKIVLDPLAPTDAPKIVAAKEKGKKIGAAPFGTAAASALAAGVAAIALGVSDKKNHDEFMAFRGDVADGTYTGTDYADKQKEYMDKGKALNGGFVASIAIAAAGVAAAAILAPFTEFGNTGKVGVQASVAPGWAGASVEVSF